MISSLPTTFFFGTLDLLVLFSQQSRVHGFLFGSSVLARSLFSKSSIPLPPKVKFSTPRVF